MDIGVLPEVQGGKVETERFNCPDETRQGAGITVLCFQRAFDDLKVHLETSRVGIRFAVNGRGPRRYVTGDLFVCRSESCVDTSDGSSVRLFYTRGMILAAPLRHAFRFF